MPSSVFAPYADVHASPKGAGDARPTALQIIKDQDLTGKLKGRTILITGCTSGLGVETARALYTTGADIFITARDMTKGKQIANDLSTDSARPVHVVQLSLDSLDSIRRGAKDFLAQSNGRLNILIDNAGVMACPLGRTDDGFETQIGTNHLGHFLLFNLLKNALVDSSTPGAESRVISVSSAGHRMTTGIRFDDINWHEEGAYSPWVAYGQSKLANIYFASELERRYGHKGVHGLSIHPGSISTNLARHLSGESMSMMKKLADDPGYQAQKKTIEQGAATQTWAAIAKELEGQGGKYYYDCQESQPVDPDLPIFSPGRSKQVYDEQAEATLWQKSLEMVGLA